MTLVNEDSDLEWATSWLEALNRFLPRVRPAYVLGATVHKEPAPDDVLVTTVGGWAFEQRRTTCRDLVLHLYPVRYSVTSHPVHQP